MDVFMLPVSAAPEGGEPRCEFYCEPPPDTLMTGQAATESAVAPSVMSRLVGGFTQALAEGEAEERREERGEVVAAEGSRIGRFLKRKLASAVAEQRLLWHLRHASAARLIHPTTVAPARALELVTAEFRKDHDKHRLWCGIDAGIVLASAPLAVVPGPNFLAYYFMFRTVGHFFSMRGARKGRDASLWTMVPSAPLSDLERTLILDPQARAEGVDAVAAALGLERLGVFMRRVAERASRV